MQVEHNLDGQETTHNRNKQSQFVTLSRPYLEILLCFLLSRASGNSFSTHDFYNVGVILGALSDLPVSLEVKNHIVLGTKCLSILWNQSHVDSVNSIFVTQLLSLNMRSCKHVFLSQNPYAELIKIKILRMFSKSLFY